jgi:ribosomal protein S18 acetylase RimI-like enzyme
MEVQDVAALLESSSLARAGRLLMTQQLTSIRRAEPGDAAALAAFASRTFRETFEPDNSAENMALYLAAHYGPERQGAEIRDPGIVTLVAEDGRRLAGYSQLHEGPAPDCVPGEAPIEIRRFYVDRNWQGRGVAQTLMMASLETALERGARTVWLAVWERNLRAQAFYRKCGFEDCGAQEFVLGRDRQTDRVMVRAL